jgi:hypothetical protein
LLPGRLCLSREVHTVLNRRNLVHTIQKVRAFVNTQILYGEFPGKKVNITSEFVLFYIDIINDAASK